MNQELSSVYIIPSWFSMLIYHLRDEQQECWWLQFRDVDLPHLHDKPMNNAKDKKSVLENTRPVKEA
jgi:hypothetical protein